MAVSQNNPQSPFRFSYRRFEILKEHLHISCSYLARTASESRQSFYGLLTEIQQQHTAVQSFHWASPIFLLHPNLRTSIRSPISRLACLTFWSYWDLVFGGEPTDFVGSLTIRELQSVLVQAQTRGAMQDFQSAFR